MDHLFRAKDKKGNLVYGSVVYGNPYESCGFDDEVNGYEYLFVDELQYNERWEVVFEDGYPEDEYYPNWDVGIVEVDWNTLEFNLNGKWIKYEVEHESSTD